MHNIKRRNAKPIAPQNPSNATIVGPSTIAVRLKQSTTKKKESYRGEVIDEWDAADFKKAYEASVPKELKQTFEVAIETSTSLKFVYINAIATMIEAQDPQYLRFRERIKVLKQQMREDPEILLDFYDQYDELEHDPAFNNNERAIMRLTIAYYELCVAIAASEIPSWDAIVKGKYRDLRAGHFEKAKKGHHYAMAMNYVTTVSSHGKLVSFFACMVYLYRMMKSVRASNAELSGPMVSYRFLDRGFQDDNNDTGRRRFMNDIENLRLHAAHESHFVESSSKVMEKFRAEWAVRVAALNEKIERGEAIIKTPVAEGGESEVKQTGESENATEAKSASSAQIKSERTEQHETATGPTPSASTRQYGNHGTGGFLYIANTKLAWHSSNKTDQTKDSSGAEKSALIEATLSGDGTAGNDHEWYISQRLENSDPDREQLLWLVKVQYRSCLCIEILANQIHAGCHAFSVQEWQDGETDMSMEQVYISLKESQLAEKKQLKKRGKRERTSAEATYDNKHQAVLGTFQQFARPIMLGYPVVHGFTSNLERMERMIVKARIDQLKPLNFGWLNKLGIGDGGRNTLVELGKQLSQKFDFREVINMQSELNEMLESIVIDHPEMAVDAVLMQKVIAPGLDGLFE